MLWNIFKSRPKKFLGIDIGTSYIKVVELRRSSQKIALENYGELGILYSQKRPFRIYEKDTLLLSEQDIAEVVQSICQEAGIKTKETNFSIPDFSSFFTTLKLPVMRKDEVAEAIKYEIRPYIPLPLSELTLDWLITGGEEEKTPLEVLVVAIPNDVINQYKEIARISGLELKALEPEVFAIVRSLTSSLEAQNEKKIISLIDIGARSTTYNILEGKVLKISHSFNIGSNELTDRLAKSLDIDYNKAEELKIKQGLSPAESGLENSNKKVREVLIPLIDMMVNEAKKIFRSFYQSEGKEIDKIILAGGLAFLPGLKEYFASEINKEVVIANPFLGVSYPSVLEETLKKCGPSYVVAVGLALKGLE